ncbi:MAG: ferrous iron transport protein B [Elusimicrobia bacterium]|nr:ferrous iron transport protein B [Elusimicrobiota bacterium]MBD3411899.1 ferrous iron transport protein B [Elusimicrobiota bacterium]
MAYTVALAGHPNSGKTTIFNRLIGAREKIGNWPGTTVERSEGTLNINNQEITVVDLPGKYSLNVHSLDERIARDFLIDSKPDLTVVIVDASNLERNLYLVVELLELGQNLVLVLNMMDLLPSAGLEINSELLSRILHIPVVETIAVNGIGIDHLKTVIGKNLQQSVTPVRIDYAHLEPDIRTVTAWLDDKALATGIPNRTLAIKLLEHDQDIIPKIIPHSLYPEYDRLPRQTDSYTNEFLESTITERRYAFIKGVITECTTHHLTMEERITISDRIDHIVTNRFLGIPIFLGLMYLLFMLVFAVGDPLSHAVETLFGLFSIWSVQGIQTVGLPSWFGSLVSDGIISGVGSVLVFLPHILLLFLGISFLEGSGYLARGAFIVDRIMHTLGLHGKSFIPMLLGFGCNIPGIMAARTLETKKDRIITIMILPLMSCSARLPVYTVFAGALFKKHQGLVVFSLYVFGIILAIIVARIFKKVFFKGEGVPLVMELPPYRLPRMGGVLHHMWHMALLFVKKAGTIIFIAVVIIWILGSLPWGVEYASEESIIGHAGKYIAPIFAPAGFGFWQAAVALLFGIVAKEVVIGTLGTLYGVSESGLTAVIPQYFSPLSGYAFLVMTLIYIPCIATIAVIRQEIGTKWAVGAVIYTLGLGWLLSVLVYQIGSFL